MPSDPPDNESISLLWKVIGVMGAAGAGMFYFLWAALDRFKDDVSKDSTAVWERVTKNRDSASDNFKEVAEDYATKSDVKEVERSLRLYIIDLLSRRK
jgi:hypothetical protein